LPDDSREVIGLLASFGTRRSSLAVPSTSAAMRADDDPLGLGRSEFDHLISISISTAHAMLGAGAEIKEVLEFVEQMCRLNHLPLHRETLSAVLVRPPDACL
jgi:hypothetical protein